MKKLLSNPSSLAGLALIVFFAAVAVAAPFLARPPKGARNPYLIPQDGYSSEPARPSAKHWFGTTESQYDLYYGMVWGTRTAFEVALFVVVTSLFIGILLGGAAGFYGGWIDEILMRGTDVVLAFPDLVLAVVIVSVTRPGLFNAMISVMLVSWPSYARLLRGDVLSIKERDFVAAARALGASDARILFRHIIPNCVYPLLVLASLSMGRIVITAAALSYLGLGAPVGYADWGQLISLSRNWIMGGSGNSFQYWHTLLIPGAAIFLFVLGWNLLGDAVRDVLDPRQRS
ncbi:MAG: ABC transporter permease [Elusimicrobia bacterium]|nr:ABC transporter permease [Elusimicrobiota bacterium]MDE2425906.1 ABC transporter permease [Elusimicrobiota bacterium]